MLKGGELLRRGEDDMDFRCIFGLEAKRIMREVHLGVCGSHQARPKIVGSSAGMVSIGLLFSRTESVLPKVSLIAKLMAQFIIYPPFLCGLSSSPSLLEVGV